MTTRSAFQGFASLAAAGVLSVLGMTASAPASAGALEAAAWLGQIEVTAPVTRLAARQARTAIANLGSMTVTATRLSTVASASATAPSSGESEPKPTKTPRAVLVQ